MLANPGTDFFSCLTVVAGELSSFFFFAFWMVFFDQTGSSTANLTASNQSVWIFLGKAQFLPNVDSDILA
jgi:hypothetical protein